MFAALVGVVRMVVGQAPVLSTCVNMVWIVFDLLVLSVIVRAARYKGSEPDKTVAVDLEGRPAT